MSGMDMRAMVSMARGGLVSHQRGLLCVGSNVGAFSLSIAQGTFLFHEHSPSLMPQSFSDWGPRGCDTWLIGANFRPESVTS